MVRLFYDELLSDYPDLHLEVGPCYFLVTSSDHSCELIQKNYAKFIYQPLNVKELCREYLLFEFIFIR
jgi:hypothetical protein